MNTNPKEDAWYNGVGTDLTLVSHIIGIFTEVSTYSPEVRYTQSRFRDLSVTSSLLAISDFPTYTVVYT